MEVKNSHRLHGGDGKAVPFEKTTQMGGNLQGGKPRFLIIHYTAGGTASGAIDTFKHGEPGNRTSAHLVLDHNGSITQMVPFDTVAWHAGGSRWKDVSGINDYGIGIEIVNWGLLNRTAGGSWSSWTNKPVSQDRVILAEHKNSPGQPRGWEVFDDAQIEATLAAARAIVAFYGMQPWDLVGHDDISPVRKVDPGPAFEMDRFRARVFGREVDSWDETLFRVNSATGLNLRTEPAIGDKNLIKKLANNATVHVIEKKGPWWLVAEVVNGDDDTTGFLHSHWLMPI